MADLAIADNERWANNATGEFVARFQVQLGGTELPYLERLAVLDQVWRRGAEYQALVLHALGKAGSAHVSRIGGAERRGRGPALPEWHPTPAEAHEARLEAFDRLARYISESADQAASAVLDVARELVWSLSRWGYEAQFEAIVTTAVRRFPELREPVRRLFGQEIVQSEYVSEHHPTEEKQLPQIIRRLHDQLRDSSLWGRLQEYVGPSVWDRAPAAASVTDLARELIIDPEALRPHIPWLMSGNADGGFEFGRALGVEDQQDRLMPLCLEASGPDARFGLDICLAPKPGREVHGSTISCAF